MHTVNDVITINALKIYSGGPNQANLNLDNRLPGQKTPTSSANPHMNNFSIPSSPHTTGAPTLSGK